MDFHNDCTTLHRIRPTVFGQFRMVNMWASPSESNKEIHREIRFHATRSKPTQHWGSKDVAVNEKSVDQELVRGK